MSQFTSSGIGPSPALRRGRFLPLLAVVLAVMLGLSVVATAAAAAPTITSLSPTSGSTAGGTTVTITGTGFTGATSVTFGGQAAGFIVNSDTMISAVSPAAMSAGVVNVNVTTPDGTTTASAANQFTYVTAGTAITSISPSSGPIAGGTSVTITGVGLTGATSVTFGGTPASFIVNSGTQITAIAPAAAAAGIVSVQVTTPTGTSPITANTQYTYGTVAPVITSLSPTAGPVAGGTTVVITGSGFSGATGVTFGGASASFIVGSDSQITAISPAAGSAGIANVVVTGPGGTSGAAQFVYGGTSAAPAVTSVSPTFGPVGGGTTVTITGTGFLGASSVTFGSTSASFAVVSDTQITAVSPAAGSTGVVNVRVTTPNGISAITSGSQFAYGTPTVPVVSSISPSSGSTAGGTVVTISGFGFATATSVTVGGVPVSFTVNSDSSITITMPASSGTGTVDIRVTTAAGTSAATANSVFTYTGSGPAVTGVSPASGPTTGGTAVMITGSGFTGATSVTFGGTAATFTVNSATQILATAPPHAAGQVEVRVTGPAGTSPSSSAAVFTYIVVGPRLCPEIPLWTNDLAYGSIGGGFWYDPVSGLVWTGEVGDWHQFRPFPPRPNPQPLWVNAITYGSRGEGFYWDPVSGLVWTAERGWHLYGPTGCVPR